MIGVLERFSSVLGERGKKHITSATHLLGHYQIARGTRSLKKVNPIHDLQIAAGHTRAWHGAELRGSLT
jgi:hypothetical protein